MTTREITYCDECGKEIGGAYLESGVLDWCSMKCKKKWFKKEEDSQKSN